MKSRTQEIAETKWRLMTLAARARDNKRRLDAERLLESYEADNDGPIYTWYLADLTKLLRMHRDTVQRHYGDCLEKIGGRWAISRDGLLAALKNAA